MESKPKQELIRIAYYEGELSVDRTGKAKGRGVYICRNRECMEKAKKRRALQRNFDAELSGEAIDKIFEELLTEDENR
jgi:Predicted nucleic-acid-binding protein implicated in transcription termination